MQDVQGHFYPARVVGMTTQNVSIIIIGRSEWLRPSRVFLGALYSAERRTGCCLSLRDEEKRTKRIFCKSHNARNVTWENIYIRYG